MSISSLRWRAASALITLGAAAAAVLALAMPAGASTGTAEISQEQAGYPATGAQFKAVHAATWTVMPDQQPTVRSEFVNGVSCPSLSFCLALGTDGVQQMVFEWNGSAWALSATPGESDYTFLDAIACPSATYCLAVGDNALGLGSSGGTKAAAWLWNGSTWAEIPAYNPSTKWNYLNAIKCRGVSDCEAVGSQSQHQGYGFHPLAEVWNGSSWSGQPVQGPHGAVSGRLDAVACASSSSCEAVGSRPSGSGGTAALAVRWNGTTWSFQKMPAVTGSSALSGVSCYRAGCTAAGTVHTTSGVSTLAEAWSGSRWALQSPAGSGNVKGAASTMWNAIHCHSAANCTIVGTWYGATGGHFTLAETWNGSTWAKDSTPSLSTADELLAMSCTPGTRVCTAVGEGGYGPAFAERN